MYEGVRDLAQIREMKLPPADKGVDQREKKILVL
jgi:hypothetical protein